MGFIVVIAIIAFFWLMRKISKTSNKPTKVEARQEIKTLVKPVPTLSESGRQPGDMRYYTDTASESREMQDYRKRIALDEKYKKVLKQHFELTELIGMKYTVARELCLPNSPEMEEVVQLCLKDIELSESVLAYWKEFDAIYGGEPVGVRFDTFKRLAIIYEKQGKYDEAIAVCKQAIDSGVMADGTEGGMIGRAARLKKKQLKAAPKLEA